MKRCQETTRLFSQKLMKMGALNLLKFLTRYQSLCLDVRAPPVVTVEALHRTQHQIPQNPIPRQQLRQRQCHHLPHRVLQSHLLALVKSLGTTKRVPRLLRCLET